MTCKRFALLDFKGHHEETVQSIITALSEMGVSVQVAGTLTPEQVDPFADLNDEETPDA